MAEEFRCSAASRDDGEPMAGSAPTEDAWLLVEYAGSWGRQALAESRLPEEVRERLVGLADVRVQLIRRHGGESGPGVRIYTAALDPAPARIETGVLDRVEDLLDLDLAALARSRSVGLEPENGPLWLVCTNGRRDRCCAELGRPVAAALADRWPDGTWETTHLGGHRFSGTYLALPSGITIGRVDADRAVAAAAEVVAGRHPVAWSRGRAGRPAPVQVAEIALVERGARDVRWAAPVVTEGRRALVRLVADGSPVEVEVLVEPGEPRRQSCADLTTKASPVWSVTRIGG